MRDDDGEEGSSDSDESLSGEEEDYDSSDSDQESGLSASTNSLNNDANENSQNQLTFMLRAMSLNRKNSAFYMVDQQEDPEYDQLADKLVEVEVSASSEDDLEFFEEE